MAPPLSRRTVLRGLGTAIALPYLEAMLPARTHCARTLRARTLSASQLTEAKQVKRLAFLYVPNGIHMQDWTPKKEGRGYDLPFILEPLKHHRHEVSVLSGLTHDKARPNGDGPGDHARAAAAFLTGVQPLKDDGQVRLGPSADQVAAQALGAATRLRSLELGCEAGGNSGQCDSGYACAYSSNISWQSETTPATKEVNPRIVFDRLFHGGEDAASRAARELRLKKRKSILDFVAEETNRLRKRLGQQDRQKLDEYFSGVRELERRIAFAQKQQVVAPDYERPTGVPRDYKEHLRLMFDLLVLAFEADMTRIATFMLANEGSNRNYKMLEIKDGHHNISHHGKDPEKLDKIRRINRFHIEQFAYFLDKLKATRVDGKSLLDSCRIVYGSSIADGNRHNHDNLPILLAGKGNGSLNPGRHVRYPKETPCNDLHVALLQGIGLNVEKLGDSKSVLKNI